MNKLIILIILFSIQVNVYSQNFCVITHKYKGRIFNLPRKNHELFFCIEEDSTGCKLYSRHIEYMEITDTLAIIAELLSYKGDKRKALYDRDRIWYCDDDEYFLVSVEVQALFMIQQLLPKDESATVLYYELPVFYNKNVAYIRKKSKLYDLLEYSFFTDTKIYKNMFEYPENSSINNRTVKLAFAAYEQWFKYVRFSGISQAIESGYYPLSRSCLKWRAETIYNYPF